MPEKILRAESIIFVGLRLDRTPIILSEERYVRAMLQRFLLQRFKHPELEFEYQRALDKIKKRIDDIERFCITYEEDYRVDFIKMVGINMGRLCSMTEEDIYELIEANITQQEQKPSQNHLDPMVNTDRGLQDTRSMNMSKNSGIAASKKSLQKGNGDTRPEQIVESP